MEKFEDYGHTQQEIDAYEKGRIAERIANEAYLGCSIEEAQVLVGNRKRYERYLDLFADTTNSPDRIIEAAFRQAEEELGCSIEEAKTILDRARLPKPRIQRR